MGGSFFKCVCFYGNQSWAALPGTMPPQYMTLRMAPVGHWLMHRPQLVHFSGSMEATLSLTVKHAI